MDAQATQSGGLDSVRTPVFPRGILKVNLGGHSVNFSKKCVGLLTGCLGFGNADVWLQFVNLDGAISRRSVRF
jgi:hypothetical protein